MEKIEKGVEKRSRQDKKRAYERKTSSVRYPVGSAQSLVQVRTYVHEQFCCHIQIKRCTQTHTYTHSLTQTQTHTHTHIPRCDQTPFNPNHPYHTLYPLTP